MINEMLFALDLVDASEKAIEEVAAARYATTLGVESVEGFPHDFAVSATCAVLGKFAERMAGEHGQDDEEVVWVRELIELVRDVPAVKAV